MAKTITWGSKLVIAENAPHIYDALSNAGLIKLGGVQRATTVNGTFEYNYYGMDDEDGNIAIEIVGSEAEIAPMDCKWRKIG